LRGCDFSEANVQGANFNGAILGWTPRQVFKLGLWIVLPTLLLADAVTRLLFGALGRTSAEQGWPLVLALYGSLAIAGLGILVPCFPVTGNRRLWVGVTGLWFGVLPGFCYGGLWSQNNVRWAIATAIAGAAIALILSCTTHSPARWAAFFSLSLITAYGFAFSTGAWAIAFFAVAELLPALGLTLFTLLYLLLTLRGGWLVYRCARSALGTSFRQANLLDATFTGLHLKGGNFEGAIGNDRRFL